VTGTDVTTTDDEVPGDDSHGCEIPSDEIPGDEIDEVREPSRNIRMVATAIVIIPFVTAVLRAVRSDWFPVGDNALLFIRTRDVWTEDHPFLGSWTSASLSVGENMNNPGALYDWLVAPFAHLLAPGPAAAIGVALINIVMVCVISAAAHRVGGWAFQRWVLLATALMAWSMGSELLIDIWQANALIFAFIALLIIGVGIAAGDDGLLPWAAFITTLLLQTHISYAYILVFLVLGVVGVRVWLRHEIDSSAWRRPVGVSAAIIAVLWAPSVWEQFFGTGKGNMSRLLGNSSGGDFSLGLDNAAQIVGSLGVRPPFWGRSGYSTTVVVTKITETAEGQTLDVPGVLPLWAASLGLTILVAMLAGLAWLAHAGRRRPETAAGILAIVVLFGSVLALSRLTIGTVGLSPHHVRWAWPLMAFVHLVIVWLAVSAWQARRRQEVSPDQRLDRGIDIVVGVLIVVVSALNIPFLAQPSGPTAEFRTLPTMNRIEPQLEQLDGFAPVLYDISTLRIYEPYSSTMMMWLQEREIEFRVDNEGMIRQLGEARRADGTEPTRIFQLEGVAARTFRGPECLLAEASLLTNDDDTAVRQLIEDAAAELAPAIGTDPESAFDAIVRREFDLFEPAQQARVDIWIDSAYALFADGDICDML
jgi:hypothetical protein